MGKIKYDPKKVLISRKLKSGRIKLLTIDSVPIVTRSNATLAKVTIMSRADVPEALLSKTYKDVSEASDEVAKQLGFRVMSTQELAGLKKNW